MQKYLYQHLEHTFREEIKSGQRAVGERLPSVRQLCSELEVSKSTVLVAYSRLESDGLIEARPRSGYFVSARRLKQNKTLKTPAPSQPAPAPAPVSAGQVLVEIMEQGAAFDLLPSIDSAPSNDQLRRSLSRALRRQTSAEQLYYDGPMGLPELRGQLAQRQGQGGQPVDKR